MNSTAPPTGFGAGPAPCGAGRLRVLVAATLALGLHAALLMPIRPTLMGSAMPDVVPTMVVRLLSHEVAAVGAPAADNAVLAPVAPAMPDLPTVASSRNKSQALVAPAPDAAASSAVTKAAVSPAPATQPGLPPAPDYFAGGRLEPGPRPLEDIDPVYPDEAKQQEGSVVLRLLINEAGAVDNVAVVRAYPAGLFERSALEAFGNAKFSPGRMLGVAVKSQITIEVMFTPINRGKVSGRSY